MVVMVVGDWVAVVMVVVKISFNGLVSDRYRTVKSRAVSAIPTKEKIADGTGVCFLTEKLKTVAVV